MHNHMHNLVYHCKKGRFTNLNSHIKEHASGNKICAEWSSLYKNSKSSNDNSKIVNEDNFLLILYFISSNVALTELKSKIFRSICLKAGINVPSYKTFKTSFLPATMNLLHEKIQELNN
jgi:hypothetical protein